MLYGLYTSCSPGGCEGTTECGKQGNGYSNRMPEPRSGSHVQAGARKDLKRDKEGSISE